MVSHATSGSVVVLMGKGEEAEPTGESKNTDEGKAVGGPIVAAE